MDEQEQIEDGYRQAAAGAQKLAESIDLLLPALIKIAAGKGTAKDMALAANSVLLQFEEHRGQRLDRARYMSSQKRAAAVKEGAALHQARAAGVAR